jgi:hypothetical protein
MRVMAGAFTSGYEEQQDGEASQERRSDVEESQDAAGRSVR